MTHSCSKNSTSFSFLNCYKIKNNLSKKIGVYIGADEGRAADTKLNLLFLFFKKSVQKIKNIFRKKKIGVYIGADEGRAADTI